MSSKVCSADNAACEVFFLDDYAIVKCLIAELARQAVNFNQFMQNVDYYFVAITKKGSILSKKGAVSLYRQI